MVQPIVMTARWLERAQRTPLARRLQTARVMKHHAHIKRLSVLVVALSISAVSVAQAEGVAPRGGQWSLSAGPGAIVAGNLAGFGGGLLSLEHSLGPHLALDARVLVGAGGGALFSGLDGWGFAAQVGGRLYLFDFLITPYVGAEIGVMKLQLEADNPGGFWGESEAEAARESETRFIATGCFGVDLTLKMGLFAAIEAQVGGAFSEQQRVLVVANARIGYRF